MSRVGKSPIPIPDKTTVDIKDKLVTVKGPKGTLERVIHPDMTAAIEENQVVVTRPTDQKRHSALHGLTRALLNNMVVGVSEGYTRELQMIGVGYRAEIKGNVLIIYVGYSHPIVMRAPEGINLEVIPKENKIIVTGIDKELVGQVAAKIRGFRPPEPYKGKGIRYVGEYVRSKAGKTAG
ncbi:MAG: 50S ribosomal protein L6 [Calditrichaeota bacterium]|nr:MAG: 50S ribosomal protein L6 [Calditrichota bacterium]